MKKILLLSFTLLLLVSCREEVFVRQGTTEGKLFTARFALASGGLDEAGSKGTSVADGLELTYTANTVTRIDAEDGLIAQESVIGEVVVAQFNGTTDAAVLVGTAQYVANYDDETLDATLTESADPNTVVFIANTGDITTSITAGMTLAQLKELTYAIPNEIIVENKDLPMVGMWTGAVSTTSLGANNQIVKVPMQRVMAKIALTVRSEVSDLTITKVNVSNVPTSVSLYTPKAATDFTTYTVTKYQGKLDERYIWYMPENMSTTENTQVDIYASKDGKTYIYTTYLNVDGGEDYTVKRNTQYNLTVTIKKLTNEVKEVDLTFDAHGEIAKLDLKALPEGRVPNYSSGPVNGYCFALSMTANINATSYNKTSDKCSWMQLSNTAIWTSSLGYNTGMPTGSSQIIYAFINENTSSTPRYARLRLRYDGIYISGSKSKYNLILNIEQKGCTIIGPFGGYDSSSKTYTKQLVMETIEEDAAMSYSAAKTICNEKFYNTADRNWYLPTQAQLTAIWINNYNSKNALKDSYWSATDNGSDAWGMDMTSGIMKSESQLATKKVRCVRDIDSTDI